MNNKIVTIPKEYKYKIDIVLLGKNIPLPPYIKNSITKHRFFIENEVIYLQRKCNNCEEFFTVQIFANDTFTNIEDLPVRFLGEKTGFYNKCVECEIVLNNTNKLPIITKVVNSIPIDKTNETQLNMEIDKDLKIYYKILAINNSTTLKIEIINALLYYKSNCSNPSKN